MRSRYRGQTICGVDQISKIGKRFRLRSHIFRSDFAAPILSDSSAPEELVSLVYEICFVSLPYSICIASERTDCDLFGSSHAMAEIVRYPDMPVASRMSWLQVLDFYKKGAEPTAGGTIMPPRMKHLKQSSQ